MKPRVIPTPAELKPRTRTDKQRLTFFLYDLAEALAQLDPQTQLKLLHGGFGNWTNPFQMPESCSKFTDKEAKRFLKVLEEAGRTSVAKVW